MEYLINIAGLERNLPLCKINDDLYIGAFIMFNDVPLTTAAAKELLSKAPDFDVIMTAESKGIPLAYEMSRQSGKPYIVARKGPKLYMREIITVEVDSITTDHVQKLCLGLDEKLILNDKKVLLVDDVISTGESLAAMEKLAQKAGAHISGKLTVLAEGEATDREDIIFLEKLPLFNSDGTVKQPAHETPSDAPEKAVHNKF